MANKMTAVSQDVVINLKAHTSEMENSVKALIQKLQGTNLSDAFTKSSISSLQKVLDKSQELKKIIGETNSVNSKTVADWGNSYNKLTTELTKMIAKIESNPAKFSDLISFDSAEYKQLKTALDVVNEKKKALYSDKNISKKLSDITSKTLTTAKAPTKIADAIKKDNQQEVNNLIDKESLALQGTISANQKKKTLLEKELEITKEISAAKDDTTGETDFTKIANTKAGTNALNYAKKRTKLGSTATAEEVTTAWNAQKATTPIKEKDIGTTEEKITKLSGDIAEASSKMAQLVAYKAEVLSFIQQLAIDFQAATQPILAAESALEKFKKSEVDAANTSLDEVAKDADQVKGSIDGAQKAAENYTETLVQAEQRQTLFSDMQTKISQIFGLANAYQGLTRFIRASWTAIKELDAAFTEIAVVTDKTTGDLWKSFDTYNDMAQRLGVTTTDAIETSALYYQQGLDTAEVMTLTTETIKMARIANMDFATATQAMTSAIRGFKLEMSDAQTITDTYSALAAEAAVDTDQLATAISKTASIAGSAGLSLQDTSAFLTQIIETTQEAPETAGTALKTIIARFTELKKNPAVLKVDVEGEEVSANKIEEALRTADVALRDTEGNFRDLDDVFLELSSKWDSLDRNTQRYIATTAAGSRQQSRFIAMMDNYERTMELVGIANDSAGAGAIQFAKTLDSVSARVNKLKSNFEALIGNLVENDTVKGILDTLNAGMGILVDASEKGIVAFSTLIFLVGKAIKSALTLVVSQFSNIAKKNEELRTKIGKTIKTTVIYQPDLTLVNEANAKLQRAPISVGTTVGGAEKPSDIQTYTKLQQKKLDLQNQYAKSYENVIAKQQIYQKMLKSEAQYTLNDASGMSQAYVQNAKKAVDSAIKDSRTAAWKSLTPTIATTVSSGVIQGMMTGIISGDWKVGLATGLVSTFSSALSNPAITKTIGNMFTKSGSTVATALAGIGGKLAAAVPYVAIAAGVAAIGYELYKWLDPVQRANRALEKAQDNLTAINNSLEKTRANFLSSVATAKSVSSDIETYKKLTAQVSLTSDEQEDYNKVVNELATQFPQLVTGYDELGNAIIDQKTNWQEILDIQKQLIAESQAGYASDVMASAQGEDTVRLAKLKKAKADLQKLETDALDAPARISEFFDSQAEITARYLEEHKTEIESLKAQIEDLGLQSELTEQKVTSAYEQIANSMITAYNAVQTNTDNKLTTDETSLIQPGIAETIKNNEELQKLSKDTSEEGKQKYIEAARSVANDYIVTIQQQLDRSKLDPAKITEALATMTIEDFKKFLAENGLTDGELYDLLLGKITEQGNGIQELLSNSKIIPDLNPLKAQGMHTFDTSGIEKLFNNQDLLNIYNNLGAKAGATYLDGLITALQDVDKTKQKDVASYLSSLNLTTVDSAKQAVAGLQSQFGMSAENAVKIVIQFVDQDGNIVTPQTLLQQTGLQQYFQNGETLNIADTALQELNTTGLTPETVETLINDFPELSGVLRQFANDTDITTDDIIGLKKALTDASNNKKSIEYFKKVGEQIEILKDNLSNIDSYEYNAAMDSLKDSFNITGLEDSSQLILDNMSDIEAAANGDEDAWKRVQLAIHNSALASLELDTNFATSKESILADVDTLTNMNPSATFTLNGEDATSQAFTSLYNNLMATYKDADKVRAIIEALTGTTITSEITTKEISVGGSPFDNPNTPWDEREGTKISVPTISFTGNKSTVSKFTPPTGGGGTNGGGGGGNDYETKTDKYYNEINAIEDLNKQLEKLADLRDKGNLSPEEYRKNLDQTAKYYKELQNQLHNYNESLRKDQTTLANQINDLKLGGAINVKNGILSADKAAISKLAATTQEKIDGMIDDWDKLQKALEENSDAWFEAKYALEELANSYRESFISAEDKIRDILIQQDQDEIDAIEKKYDKLKEADEDYLEALKDNIDKRRDARDKETDYADLAKKEKRLALLKRDTSGVYGAEILSLEEEIAQTRQDLSDKEVDDMVTSLEEQATKRADSYDKELEELNQLQDDKEKSMVEYNKEVDRIMQSGSENILKWLQKYDDEYLTASKTAQQEYLEGWKNTINEANGYVNNVANGTVATTKEAAATKAQGYYSELATKGYAQGATDIQSHNAADALKWYNDYVANRKDLTPDVKKLFWNIVLAKYQWAGTPVPGYSEGGIVNTTGLAMVHGTTTKPEAFLSAADTKNFQILMELLNKAVGYKGNTQSDIPTALQIGECQIIVEVGSISDDYDVEQAVDKVKQAIVDNSNYRNVNIVTRKK